MDPDPYSISYILISFPEFVSEYSPVLLILLVLLFFSALASGTEVAFFSLSQAEIHEFRQENGRVWDLLRKPKKLLATILIFNNLVNVAIILLASLTVEKIFRQSGIHETEWGAWVKRILEVGVITFVLLFFGEITPKVYASQNRMKLVRLLGWPVSFMRLILSPISFILLSTTNFLDRRVSAVSSSASFADIKHAIDLTNEEESPEEEKEILKGIVNFSSTQVKSVMRARVDVMAVDIKTPLEDIIEIAKSEGYSRMPVYEESLDNVKGILYVKDLLPLLKAENRKRDWQTLIRPAYFIPETKKIDDLMDEFKSRRLHIAVVVDEFGGTAGIVTLEDIIEEIFGEIVDEFDEEERVFSKLNESTYIFDGKMPLNDLIRTLGLPDNSFEEARGDADSLAGLILQLHGKIPEKDTQIIYAKFRFSIESVAKNRVKRVKMEILAEFEVPEKEHESESEKK